MQKLRFDEKIEKGEWKSFYKHSNLQSPHENISIIMNKYACTQTWTARGNRSDMPSLMSKVLFNLLHHCWLSMISYDFNLRWLQYSPKKGVRAIECSWQSFTSSFI